MRKKKHPIATLVSDVHLSPKSPIARAEEDWLGVQWKYLNQLKKIAGEKTNGLIVYAGDIFHRWDSPPELISFAIRHLPKGIAIPGQHDLPNHDYDQIERSAYWTLIEAGVLTNLVPGEPQEFGYGVFYHGFPWGFKVTPYDVDPTLKYHPRPKALHVAVVHDYCWRDDSTKYEDAPEENHVRKFLPKLKGYDVAHFGDNHKGFNCLGDDNKPWVYNGGTFIRRNGDERDYLPHVGILYSNGSVSRHFLDVKKDKFSDVPDLGLKEAGIDPEELLNELRLLGDSECSFKDAIVRYLRKHKVGEAVQKLALQYLEGKT